MSEPSQLEILQQGVSAWNKWREQNIGTSIDLSAADLSNLDLRFANLTEANLNGAVLVDVDLREAKLNFAGLLAANLEGANLSWADASRAHLRESNLVHTNLSATNFEEANLSWADLRQSDLTKANLSTVNLYQTILCDANLSYTNLTDARLFETVLTNLDLRTAIGLDLCQHYGPSTLDHRTLMRSGNLPMVFVRGCGLPDRLIDYFPSLMAPGPIQFYSCFISYSTQDQKFADRLHSDLQNKGVRCWFAPHDVQGGRKLHEQIDEAIRLFDKLLLILSQASINSEWVRSEIAKSRRRELREDRRMLFPLRLMDFETLRDWECFDADSGKDSAREIREYFIPDFSHWKTDHDAYINAFDRLLKDLKTEDRPKL